MLNRRLPLMRHLRGSALEVKAILLRFLLHKRTRMSQNRTPRI
jgi:hypothetical protein